jgi:hypothetical protein
MKVLTFIVIAMFATVGFAADKAAEKKDEKKTEKKADAKK